MQPGADDTVAERIRARFDSLTRAERQLANAILENYPVSGLGSITALAEAAGVSTPTVARMARKLGYAGFPSLQAALRTELEARISSPLAKHERWAAEAPDAHILNRFAAAAVENLRQTLGRIEPEAFDAVVRLLTERRRTLHFVGGRITRAIADYFFTHMQALRPGTVLLPTNASLWPHYLIDMKRRDVLVAFDIRRYERGMLRLVEAASTRGAEVVLFTDQWGSPAARHARHVFHCRVEAPSPWDSSIVTLFIVEALVSAVATRSWKQASARMSELEELFDRMRLFRKFV